MRAAGKCALWLRALLRIGEQYAARRWRSFSRLHAFEVQHRANGDADDKGQKGDDETNGEVAHIVPPLRTVQGPGSASLKSLGKDGRTVKHLPVQAKPNDLPPRTPEVLKPRGFERALSRVPEEFDFAALARDLADARRGHAAERLRQLRNVARADGEQ